MTLWIITYAFCIMGAWQFPDAKRDNEYCARDMIWHNVEFFSDQKAAMVEYKKLKQNDTVANIKVHHLVPAFPQNSMGEIGCRTMNEVLGNSCWEIRHVDFVPSEPALVEVVKSTMEPQGTLP